MATQDPLGIESQDPLGLETPQDPLGLEGQKIPPIKLDPLQQFQLNQMRAGQPISPEQVGNDEFIRTVANEVRNRPLGFAKDVATLPFQAAAAPGRLAFAAAADLISKVPEFDMVDGELIRTDRNREFGGNLEAMQRGEDVLPAKRFIASAAPSSRKLAVAANLASTAPEFASQIVVNPTGVAGKLIALGFSADMVANSAPMFAEYANEFYKPDSEQDKGKMADLESQILQTGLFAPIAARHGARDVAITAGDRGRLAVRELAKQLGTDPAVRDWTIPDMRGQSQRQLGLPRATAEPFLQPGVPELADAALREQMNPIIAPGRGGALRDLRNAVEGAPDVISESRAVKPNVGGGKVSFAASAEARGIPNARQSVIKQIPDSVEAKAETPRPPGEPPAQAEPPAAPIEPRPTESTPAGGALRLKEVFDAGDLKRGNQISTEVGLTAKTLDDLKAIAGMREESSARRKELQKNMETIDDALIEQQKAQLARESIEVATDTGSWQESQSRDFAKLGDRPLDWRKNPEVAKWLSENAEKLGIELPEGFRVSETKPPAQSPVGAPRDVVGEAQKAPGAMPVPSAAGGSDLRWEGRAFRALNYNPPKNASVGDLVKYEGVDLGNADIQAQAEKAASRLGLDLSKIPAKDALWVTRTPKEARQYGGVADIREYDVTGWIKLVDIGSDGALVVRPQKLSPAPENPATTGPTIANASREEIGTRPGENLSQIIKRSDFKSEQDWKDAVEATEEWARDPNQFSSRSQPSLSDPWTLPVFVEPNPAGGFRASLGKNGQTVGLGATEEAAIKAAEGTYWNFHKKPLQISPANKSTATTVPTSAKASREEIGDRPGGPLSQTQLPKPEASGKSPGQVGFQNESKPSDTAKQIADKLRNLKSGVDPKKGDLGTFNVIPKVWDAAIEVAAKIIEKGGTVADAINAALKHIRANNGGKSFLEREARRELELALQSPAAAPESSPSTPAAAKPAAPKTGGAAGVPPSTPAPRTPPSSPGAPAPRGTTLDDVYRIFEPAPKPSTPIRRRAVNIVEGVRTGLSSKFRPLNKLAEDIAKAYGRTNPKDVAGIFEQLKGSQGKGEADIYRFDRDVSKLVEGSEKDFNAYMFLRRSLDRLNQDAADIQREISSPGSVKALNRRAVSNYTIPELQSKLNLLESNLGPDKLAKFQDAADRYQSYMDAALRLQVESGRMSQEVYNVIKNGNQFYAPFKVMKYIEEASRPDGTSSKIDTVAQFTKAMEGIEDPNFKLGDMLGAARQSILLSRILADKNTAMRNISELAAFDPNHLFVKKLKSGEDAPTGMKAVNVFEAGKQTRYAVNEAVAEALNIYGGNAAGVFARVLGYGSIPFRWGATALNLPFQISNLLADAPRAALVSRYGVRGLQDLVRYPMDFIHSLYSSIAGDVLGKDNKLFLDFLDSGVAGTTVQEYLTPEALKFKEPTSMSRSKRLASTVIDTVPKFAQAIEQTSKVLGVKRAMRFEGVSSGAELAKHIPEAITEIRRFSGSPDFGRQGKTVEGMRLNLLYMFLNARIQGTIADVGRLSGRDGARAAASTWLRVGAAVTLPTAYLYYLNNLPENREDYGKRSDQEKQNYWLIPKEDDAGNPRYIRTETGETVRDYWRIPKREVSKWFANLTEAGLRFAEDRDPEAALSFGNAMLQELVPVNIQGNTAQEKLESVASGLNPLLKAPLELSTGRDLYRHRDLMSDQLKKASPEEQFNDRTPEAFKAVANAMPDIAPEFLRSPIILENMTRNLTAGLLTQFMHRKPVEGRSALENQPLLQRFQSLPYEDNTEFKETMKSLEREAADEQLNRHRVALKVLESNRGKGLEETVGSYLTAVKAGTNRPDSNVVKTTKHIVDLWVSDQNGATQQDRQLLSLPTAQRAEYIKKKMGEIESLDERQRLLLDMARKRILTEAVLLEMSQP